MEADRCFRLADLQTDGASSEEMREVGEVLRVAADLIEVNEGWLVFGQGVTAT
jgi:hypothetical protein